MTRYFIVTWHGESASHFHVVDRYTDEVVQTFKNDRAAARVECDRLNGNSVSAP